MSPLHISNSTQNSTNCPKSVNIHITKRHCFIVLYSLHSLYPSVYVYMNMRITMVMLLRHTGHVSITATRFAQLSQKRACPQDTSANPSRGATKHTSQVVSAAASAAVCGAVDVVVGVAAVISVVGVTVAVRRLQRRRVSAHGMTNGTQELRVENKTRCRTWPDRT